MIYHNLLDSDLALLKASGETAWQIVSAAIAESQQGHVDTALAAGLWMQDTHCAEGASQFDDTNSRQFVSLGTVRGRESCVEVDKEHATEIFYRDSACREGKIQHEEYSPHKPSLFEPKCIVLLLEADSRSALRDELVESGRILTDPVRIDVNYTVALSANADLRVTSSNCALGRELRDLYEHDRVGQAERDALLDAQERLSVARVQFTTFENVYLGLSVYRPPTSPPPPASPPSTIDAPPSAPVAVPFALRLEQLRKKVDDLVAEVASRNAAIEVCVPSNTQTCGRSSILAPNPWIAANNEPCFGNGTDEALEGAYCAHWGSQVNVDAAESEEAAELQTEDGAPYCFSHAGAALKCSVLADRNIRAGKYEMQEWLRPDRPQYCQSDLFKEIVLDSASTSEAVCRETIRERIDKCDHGVCSKCISPCNYPVARTIGSIMKCTSIARHFGFLHYYQNSDAGQLARSMHGAVRKDGYLPVPEKLAAHLYRIAHNNPKGYIQRDAIACRREHRNSPAAKWVGGFDDEGMPITRSGFMVPCKRDSDCGICSRHPLTGQFARCQKTHVLYDTVETDEKGNVEFRNTSDGSSNSFDIDMDTAATTGKTGVCVDFDASMNEGCGNPVAAALKDGAIGCFDGNVRGFLCGLSLEAPNGDLAKVEITGNKFYPRVLVQGSGDADGDGVSNGAITCSDPIDCTQKCLYLEKTARHGFGAPPSCAMCDQYCSSNILTTVTDMKDAIWQDVLTIGRLLAVCFGSHGISGCICQFALTLQPTWRAISTNKDVRCEGGDPFNMLLKQLDSLVINWMESGVNWVVDAANSAISKLSFGLLGSSAIPRFCFPNHPHDPGHDCNKDETEAEQRAWLACNNPDLAGGLDMLCYYKRLATICSSDDMVGEYDQLFAKGYEGTDELQKQLASAFGDSFAYLDPALVSLVEQAHISTTSGPELTGRREICSSAAFGSSMRLDQIITSCFFAMAEKMCPDGAEEDEEFAFTIEATSFKLPTVRFDYGVSPPPPPPVLLSGYQLLVDNDPEGFIQMRRRLESWFPKLSHVATSSVGASIGGWIADFEVSPQQITRAFLASRGVEKDSLGARVLESKHTGRWRYACKELHDFMGTFTSPGRKSHAYAAGTERQHIDHNGEWDRNPLLYAMLEIKLSMNGHGLAQSPFSMLAMHDRICGGGESDLHYQSGSGPAGWRSATPEAFSATHDFQAGTEIANFAPLIAVGSLETLRSMRATALASCVEGFSEEDAVVSMACGQGDQNGDVFYPDLYDRQSLVPFAMQRDRWCNAGETVSIESSVGNPFQFVGEDLFDTEQYRSASLNNMRVPWAMRGEEKMDADFRSKSLMGWVLVTSSADPNLRAGIYRLLDLPVFRSTPCSELPRVVCTNTGENHLKISLRMINTALEAALAANDAATVADLRRDSAFTEIQLEAAKREGEFRLNFGGELLDVASTNPLYTEFKTGRDALTYHRCSKMVSDYTGVTHCHHNVYANSDARCSTSDMNLISVPTTYGSKHFLDRLISRPQPGPPPSPTEPPPSPPPASPLPPPLPLILSQREVMQRIRGAESRMCTSVYFLSQTTRCERLAVDLSSRVSMTFLAPPAPPPAGPQDTTGLGLYHPAPPPPLLPALPVGLVLVWPRTARLSTLRMPTENADADSLGYYTVSVSALIDSLRATDSDKRACVLDAPLACASGTLHCLNDLRRCGASADNSLDPFLDLNFDIEAGHYLWALHLELPQNDQLAELSVGKIAVELFNHRGEPVLCAEANDEVLAVPSNRIVEVVCHPPAGSDAQIHALGEVSNVRITQKGPFRQIWFQSVKAIARSFRDAGVWPVPVSGSGSAPPSLPNPPNSPTIGSFYTFTPFATLDQTPSLRVTREPCGTNVYSCALAALGECADGFEIDDAGCCILAHDGIPISLVNQTGVDTPKNYWTARSGVGVLDPESKIDC